MFSRLFFTVYALLSTGLLKILHDFAKFWEDVGLTERQGTVDEMLNMTVPRFIKEILKKSTSRNCVNTTRWNEIRQRATQYNTLNAKT